jgi:hypothetical protein
MFLTRPLHNSFERQLLTFWGTHPGEANGPRQWANPKLFKALGPSMSAKVAPDGLNRGTTLRSVLGFGEQARAWVKKFILRSEKGLCKGLPTKSLP